MSSTLRFMPRIPPTARSLIVPSKRVVSAAVSSPATRLFATAGASVANVKQVPDLPPSMPQYVPSIWDAIFNRTHSPRIPLTQEFPGVPKLSEQPLAPLTTTPQISTLSNGLRVASLPSHSAIASIGVFIDVGSRYETRETNGLTHFLELMSLKSTSNRTDFRLVREMLKMGANITASSSRESLVYSADCLREHVPAIIGTLADVLQNHIFHIEEVLEEKEMYEEDAPNRDKQMDLRMMESIHEAAYFNNTLGMKLFTPMENVHMITPEALYEHQQKYCTPKRMVISAVGIEHDQLIKLLEAAFTSLPPDTVDASQTEKANYTGGDVRHVVRGHDDELTHVSLAFETASWHDKDLVPMCVLQMMMGGGGSFSAGGPGKGMYSRLYSNILNRYDWAESATSFNSIFTDSALFGFYGTSAPDKAGSLVDALSKEAVRMGGKVDDTELKRAKAQLKSAIYMQLESRPLKLEDMGRQLIQTNSIQTADELRKLVDAVGADDIRRVATNMLKKPLSLAALGDITFVPRYDIVQKHFS